MKDGSDTGDRPAILTEDTSRLAEDLQVKIWRSMTPARKLELAADTSDAVRELARAGIRHRHPAASDEEVTWRLARLALGENLAARAYPGLAQLSDDRRS